MILRRFMQHMREQNWLAVGIDIVVVMGSVLVATQISVQIEEGRQQRDLQRALNNLVPEILQAVEWRESAVAWQKRKLKGLRDAIEIVEGASPENFDREQILLALTFATDPPTYPAQYVTLDEIQATGRLKDIPGRDLREFLVQLLSASRSNASDMSRAIKAGDTSPLAYDFLERQVERGTPGWGAAKVIAVDWVQARNDGSFLNRLKFSHQTMASIAFSMDSMLVLEHEALRLLNERGYGTSETYWQENYDRITSPLENWTGEVEPVVDSN